MTSRIDVLEVVQESDRRTPPDMTGARQPDPTVDYKIGVDPARQRARRRNRGRIRRRRGRPKPASKSAPT